MAVLGAVWSGCGAGLLGVPVGGGPPARSPHASLRLGAVDLEARPGPAAADGHRSQALPPPMGPQSGPPVPPVPFTPVGLVTLMGGSARRLVVRPSPTAAHGPAVRPCRPGGRLSETGVAFAHVWLCGVETGIAFACEKWVFLVRFLGAVVMPVSAVRCWGCAVVLLVSMSPWCRVWCARKFARRRCVIAKVRKSSPSALNLAQLQRFCACWRVFSRGCRWRGCAG